MWFLYFLINSVKHTSVTHTFVGFNKKLWKNNFFRELSTLRIKQLNIPELCAELRRKVPDLSENYLNTPAHIAEVPSQILGKKKKKVSTGNNKKVTPAAGRGSLLATICSQVITSNFMVSDECFRSSLQHPRSGTKQTLGIVHFS